jgi:hypothetical protein
MKCLFIYLLLSELLSRLSSLDNEQLETLLRFMFIVIDLDEYKTGMERILLNTLHDSQEPGSFLGKYTCNVSIFLMHSLLSNSLSVHCLWYHCSNQDLFERRQPSICSPTFKPFKNIFY